MDIVSGEYVAATLSGVFSLEDAISVVITRGKLMQEMPEGNMLSIQATDKEIASLVAQHHCEIAVINAIDNYVISGTKTDILSLRTVLDEQSIPSIVLQTSHAYHSKMMEKAAKDFLNVVKTVKLNPPTKKFAANVSGDFITLQQATNPEYWSQQITSTVKFNDNVSTFCNYYKNELIFIEVGPGKGLSTFIKGHVDQNKGLPQTIQLVKSYKEQTHASEVYSARIEDLLSILWTHGLMVNLSQCNHFSDQHVVKLPRYQFDSQSYWINKSSPIISGHKLVKAPFVKIENKEIKILETNYSELEYQIAQIYCKVLGVDEVSLQDNFFDLGGNSLLAIKLVSSLKTININMSINDVLKYNSIEKIFQLQKNNEVKNMRDSIIVPLKINNAQSNDNVFFVHAIGGIVIGYNDIVKELDKTFNYYGIQNINALGKEIFPIDSIEELAKIYLDEILKIQPTGDYILMGSSLGGTLSYEIARELMQKGKKVKCIAMFDTWAIFNEYMQDENNFKDYNQKQLIKYQDSLKDINPDQQQHLIDAMWKLMEILFAYKPKKNSAVKIHLFKATELDKLHVGNMNYPDNAWQQYTDVPVSIYNIEGDHNSILQEPGRNEIIKYLNRILSELPH